MSTMVLGQLYTRCSAASLQTAVAAADDGSTIDSLQRSGSMPRSYSATTKQSSALRRSSTLPNDRRGSKVSFGAALQVSSMPLTTC